MISGQTRYRNTDTLTPLEFALKDMGEGFGNLGCKLKKFSRPAVGVHCIRYAKSLRKIF